MDWLSDDMMNDLNFIYSWCLANRYSSNWSWTQGFIIELILTWWIDGIFVIFWNFNVRLYNLLILNALHGIATLLNMDIPNRKFVGKIFPVILTNLRLKIKSNDQNSIQQTVHEKYKTQSNVFHFGSHFSIYAKMHFVFDQCSQHIFYLCQIDFEERLIVHVCFCCCFVANEGRNEKKGTLRVRYAVVSMQECISSLSTLLIFVVAVVAVYIH